MNTLTIKLKQHTPLIHFQHDQEDATLRASEVKPKLDKFILSRLGNGNYQTGKDIAKNNGWLIGRGEHPALDYKMRIEATNVEKWNINERQKYTQKHQQRGKPFIQQGNERYLAKIRNSDRKTICELKPYPSFFANLDADYSDPNEYRKFSFTVEPVSMVLTIKDNTLYNYINDADLLNDFFFQTNFGTRQSKGFGSFSIDSNDAMYRSRRSKYRFMIEMDNWDNIEYIDEEYKKVFECIELFYKTLRGGINLKNAKRETIFYFKSLAYMYAKDYLDAKWDKRKIKESFYNDTNRETNLSHAYDVRDMLGFSTSEQWLSYGDSIEKSSEIADRMQSPILFKPFFDEDHATYHINIIFQDDKVNMTGFKEGRRVKVHSKHHRGQDFYIDLPQTFSTESFFNYIFEQLGFDISNHVEEEYQGHEYFEILDYIYTQIKDNLQ